MKKHLTASALILAIGACSDGQNLSNISGHFEHMTEEEAEARVARYQPFAIPEHETTAGVIISGELVMDFHLDANGYLRGHERTDIARSILDTGVDLIVVTPAGFDLAKTPNFERFKYELADSMDRISFLPAPGNRIPSVWARDWGPIQAVGQAGENLLLDFNYYPGRPVDDFVPSLFKTKSEQYLPRISVPVYNEGGNFMSNSRGECLMSSRVTDANQEPDVFFVADELLNPVFDRNGQLVVVGRDNIGRKGTLHYNIDFELKVRVDDMYLSEEEIADYYRRYAGCNEVIIMPRMPFEGTGHIDMWAKFINDDEILINEIRDEQLVGITDLNTLQASLIIQRFLRDRTSQLQSLGYKITKLPMPLPQYELIEYQGEVYENFIIRSYTNSLIIQTGEGSSKTNTAIIPQYLSFHTYITDEDGDLMPGEVDYVDQHLIPYYEGVVTEAYLNAGYNIDYVVSDDLIAIGGAIHCVTMQLAKPVF